MTMGGDAWPVVRIGDLGEVFTGRTPPTKRPAYFGEDFPFITPGDMRQGKYARATQRNVSHAGAELLKRIQIPANSVCVSCIGWQMGEVIMTNKPSFTNQQINSIVPNGKVEPSFLYYSLRPRKQELLSLGAATGVRTPILNKSAFCDLKVKVPSLPMQRRIAGILSAYDELIENSQRRIRILEEMARALYREWFVSFRIPTEVLTKLGASPRLKLVDSPLGPIPESWEVRAVSDLASLISRGPGIDYVKREGIPVVNQRCVRDGVIQWQAVQYASPLTPIKSHLYLQMFDCLINSMGVGTLGRVSRNLSITERAIIHNCITVVRAAEPSIVSAFLYYFLSSKIEHFESQAVGATGQTSLRIEDIAQLKLPKPDDSLLRMFAGNVMPIWEQIGNLLKRQSNLYQTRDLLLPRLLAGQVALDDLNV